MINRQQLGQSRRWVVKVGSSLITNAGRGLDEAFIAGFVAQAGIALLQVQRDGGGGGVIGGHRRGHEAAQLEAASHGRV